MDIEELAACIKDTRKRMRAGESRASIYADYANTGARKDVEMQLTRIAGSKERTRYRYANSVLLCSIVVFSIARLIIFPLSSNGIFSNPVLRYGVLAASVLLVPYLLSRFHKVAYKLAAFVLLLNAVKIVGNFAAFQTLYGKAVPIFLIAILLAWAGLSIYLAKVLFPPVPRDQNGHLLFDE